MNKSLLFLSLLVGCSSTPDSEQEVYVPAPAKLENRHTRIPGTSEDLANSFQRYVALSSCGEKYSGLKSFDELNAIEKELLLYEWSDFDRGKVTLHLIHQRVVGKKPIESTCIPRPSVILSFQSWNSFLANAVRKSTKKQALSILLASFVNDLKARSRYEPELLKDSLHARYLKLRKSDQTSFDEICLELGATLGDPRAYKIALGIVDVFSKSGIARRSTNSAILSLLSYPNITDQQRKRRDRILRSIVDKKQIEPSIRDLIKQTLSHL